jgi:hypothetical protein
MPTGNGPSRLHAHDTGFEAWHEPGGTTTAHAPHPQHDDTYQPTKSDCRTKQGLGSTSKEQRDDISVQLIAHGGWSWQMKGRAFEPP